MTARIKAWLHSPYRWVIVIALLGVLVSTWTYQASLSHEQARLQAHFNHLATDRVLRVQGELDQVLTALLTVGGFFDASEEVTRDEFRLMVTPLLERHPDIMAINWAPRVLEHERANYEKKLRAEGYARQGFFEVTHNAKNTCPAARREQYFPVLYIEPIQRNQDAIGIDAYSRTESHAAMDRALNEGSQWSSRPLPLVQDPQGPLAVAVFQPVYRLGAPLRTRAQREAALRGFVTLVLRPAVTVEAIFKPLSPVGLDTQLFDNSKGLQLLHHHFGRVSAPAIRPGESLRRGYALTLPGRIWTLQITATEGFHAHADSHVASAVLFSGLLANTLFSLIFWGNTRYSLRQAHLSEDLKESESRFRQLAENINTVFWINTPDWRRVLYISPAYQRIWGRSVGSLYANGMDWFNAVLEEDRSALMAHMPANTQTDWRAIEFPPYRILRPDGSVRWISARAHPVRDATGTIVRVAGIAEDITERQAYQQHLEELAHFDPLTHLPNRRLLADRMHLALAHSQRAGQLLAVCMLDLDGFKPVNDKFGHKVGDQLLMEVARRLLASVRGDDTVARVGGDEFVLLLGELLSVKEADEALTRILQILAAPYHLISGRPISISASIGVTLYPDDASDPDTLLRHADHAMYLAKEDGKNRFHQFNPLLEQRELEHIETLRLIRKAADEDQLTLFYQPIVDCRQGLVVGMEALLRWNHPALGLMQPKEFLFLIEGDDDLAHSVGAWVLRHALNQARTWHDAGLNIPVSVNVFAQQLRDPNFPDRLRQLLAEYPELPADSLIIEIMESAALDDIASVARLMEISVGQGVRYALDNFGTGFSSLTYLRRLPVSSLKIDQSFVHEMLQDPENLAIVEGVIGLAAAFHHQAVAEGVESIEHTLMLMEMGCNLAQGFAIAPPMPGAATTEWLKNFQPDPRWLENTARRLSRDDFQLLLAEVDHRQWLAQLQSWMRLAPENRGPSPPLDKRQCDFGHWYYSEGGNRYGRLAAFQRAEQLHDRVHRLAEKQVRLNETDDIRGSRQAEADLNAASEKFRAMLGEIRAAVKQTDAGQ